MLLISILCLGVSIIGVLLSELVKSIKELKELNRAIEKNKEHLSI